MKQQSKVRRAVIAALSVLTVCLIALLAYVAGRSSNQAQPPVPAEPEEVSAAVGEPVEEPAPEVSIPDLAQSVLYLETYDEYGGGVALGSGFLIDDAVLVTNFHVIEDACSLSAFTPDLALSVQFDRLLAWDEEVDLAILGAARSPGVGVFALGDSDAVRQGDKIYAVGYPHGLANTLSDGIVSAIYPDDGVTLLQITAPISSGNSGGPVLNERGEVVGVVTMFWVDSQNLNFAVSSNDVARLRAQSGEEISLEDFYFSARADAEEQPPASYAPPTRPVAPAPAPEPVAEPEPEPESAPEPEPKYTLEQLKGGWSFYNRESETILYSGKVVISDSTFYYEDYSSIGGLERTIVRAGTIDRLTDSGFVVHVTEASRIEDGEPWPQELPWDWEITVVSCDEHELVLYNPVKNSVYHK